ncbi:MAG: ATP-binding protein [Sulfurovaceae bacterium]|nr:ATP-binding protein [Sulfurovaceae bacterium]
MKDRFQIAKNAFFDTVNIDDYIEIESSSMVMNQLKNAIHKPFKIVILYGKPGTGKSLLLKNLFEERKCLKEMYFFETPANNQKEFLWQLFKAITKEDISFDTNINFLELVDYCRRIQNKKEIIFLIDEAQMYSKDIFELIRLLADTNTIKFIVSLHQHGNEELFAQTHFSSRIWEKIELKNATPSEQSTYINKKLVNKNLNNIADYIQSKNLKLIYKYTKGNYRECNKLMFTIFEIYEYYDRYQPLKIANSSGISRKIIEMAGLKLGYINA